MAIFHRTKVQEEMTQVHHEIDVCMGLARLRLARLG